MAARARGKNSLVGFDFADICRRVGEQLEAEQPQRMAEQEAAVRRTENAFEGQHSYVVRIIPYQRGVVAESQDPFPLVGYLKAPGRDQAHALTELRWAYACELVKLKLMPDIDSARAYALKCAFFPRLDVPRIMSVVR